MRGEPAVGNQHRVFRHDLVEFPHEAADVDRRLGAFHAIGGAGHPFGHALRNFRKIVRAGPGAGAIVVEHLVERAECQGGIADKADVRSGRAANFCRVDLNVDQRFARRDQRKALGCDLAELAAHDEQTIGSIDQVIGDAVVAPEETGGQRMRTRNGSFAGHRMGNRDALAIPPGSSKAS